MAEENKSFEEEEYDDDEVEKLNEEIKSWKAKYKTLELKKRESDLNLNKIKTEINSLRSMDKLWKDASKNDSFKASKSFFDEQIDGVIDSLQGASRNCERITSSIPPMRKLKDKIAQYQRRIAEQEETIMKLNGIVRTQAAEIERQNDLIRSLSGGIDEEVERLMKPVRMEVGELMTNLMKEKAARAQERRELADLWPQGTILPSLLMRYRALTPAERERRRIITIEQNASRALATEIRANVAESKMWEMQYDDYGRPFYEHKKTGETSWDQPEILSYKPPPGRDEMGNIIVTEESDLNNWVTLADHRGQVYFRNKLSGDITYVPPNAYKQVPKGKSRKQVVAEAAQIVLNHMKERIRKHIKQQTKRKHELDNPMTVEERKKKEKEMRNRVAETSEVPKRTNPNDSNEDPEDEENEDAEEDGLPELAAYQYDIETVEMLAISTNDALKKINQDKDPEQLRIEKRQFLVDNAIRAFDEGCFIGPTLAETDVAEMDVEQLRVLVEKLALTEEQYERRLSRLRDNIRDFSFVLMQRTYEHDEVLEQEQRLLFQQQVQQQQQLELELLNDQKKRRRLMLAEYQSNAADTTVNLEGNSNDDNPEEVVGVETPATINDNLNNDSNNDNTNNSDLTRREQAALLATTPQIDNSADAVVDDEAQQQSDADDDAQPEDEQVELISEYNDDEQLPPNLFTYKIQYPTLGAILFGDIQLQSTEPDCTEDMLKFATDLSNFAMFCGYLNIHSSDYLTDTTHEFSLLSTSAAGIDAVRATQLMNSNTTSNTPNVAMLRAEVLDDEWLTNSFFLTTSKDTVRAERVKALQVHAQLKEFLAHGNPGDSAITKSNVVAGDGVRDTSAQLNHGLPYRQSITAVQEAYSMTQYTLWKHAQLINDVVRSQIQQECVLLAYQNRLKHFSRFQAVNQSIKQRRDSVYLNITKAKLTLNRPFTKLTNNNYYVNFSFGNWMGRTNASVPGKVAVEWNSLQLQSKVLINQLQLDELLVEVLDEMAVDPQLFRVGSATVNISNTLGYNLGQYLHYTVELHNTRIVQVEKALERPAEKEAAENDADEQGSGKENQLNANNNANENANNEEESYEDSTVMVMVNETIHEIAGKLEFTVTADFDDRQLLPELDPLYLNALEQQRKDDDAVSLQINLDGSRNRTTQLEDYGPNEEMQMERNDVAVSHVRSDNGGESNNQEANITEADQQSIQDNVKVSVDIADAKVDVENIAITSESEEDRARREKVERFTDSKHLDPGNNVDQAIIRLNEIIEDKRVAPADEIIVASLPIDKTVGNTGNDANKDALVATTDADTTSNASATMDTQHDQKHINQHAVSEQLRFLNVLVGDMRGDGQNFIKNLVGDVDLTDIRKTKFQVNEHIVAPLPNFQKTSKFLTMKTDMHKAELQQLNQQITNYWDRLEGVLQKKYEDSEKAYAVEKIKLKKSSDQIEDMKKDVLRIQDLIAELRKPLPMPVEPNFPEFSPVNYPPKIPSIGGMDAKGKRKKQIPNAEMKKLVENIEMGHLDGTAALPFPENLWPSQSQQLKINKALELRTSILDIKRDQEVKMREQIYEVYKSELEKRELNERRRLVELEKRKKECRKANIRYDHSILRFKAVQKTVDNLEFDYTNTKNLRTFQSKSKESFQLVKFKHYMEYKRQKILILNIKKRLLKALNTRKFALNLPATAKNELELADLISSSEIALKTLRYEVFECKQLLIDEGVKLRTLYTEERNIYNNELTRVKVCFELLKQRRCCDQIVERFRYEVVHNYNELERMIIAEADKDDTGQLDTVDDLGERYVDEKLWNESSIQQCLRFIQMMKAKIDTLEGFGASVNLSQQQLLNITISNFGGQTLSVRDSYIEKADHDRAQMLLQDALIWLHNERLKFEHEKTERQRAYVDIELQLNAAKQQRDLGLVSYETETKTISESTSDVVRVMRMQLDTLRRATDDKIKRLEDNVTELSRECQKVREELLQQKLLFDEKLKILWAFIDTLQTTVQQISVKMEIILEEREKMVIASKLQADKMRYQLRVERKYAANLTFVIHAQRGTMKYLQDVIRKLSIISETAQNEQRQEKNRLKREIWEQIFCFTRLGTDVDALFEFFVSRIANLAGSREVVNDALARNGAAVVLGALCKSPRPLIRKHAARALGGMGWNGYVETRILLWDCMMSWQIFKASVLVREKEQLEYGFEEFNTTEKIEAILNINGDVEEFVPSGNLSLRTIIKQRRQWALRAARRRESPNFSNMRMLNIKDGVIPALLELSLKDGDVDWEICRNAALAVSIASYEPQNHLDMIRNQQCAQLIIRMCVSGDAEVQTHAAVTIANLSHQDEAAQEIFGSSGAVPILLELCTSNVVDVLEAATCALANITSYNDANCQRALEANGIAKVLFMMTNSYSENLLDLDQNEEVQANGAEMLANVSRYNTEYAIQFFDSVTIDALTLMCASTSKQLKRYIPLVLGNIAQSETCRESIGVKGGIEALFLTLEDSDTTIQANVLWSLCNLMWHPPNQERAGRFMNEILLHFNSSWEPVSAHASALLANVLFYNTPNRLRFLEIDGAMETLLGYIKNASQTVAITEGSLRALLSLSYLDSVAMWLGPDAGMIPVLISYLAQPFLSRDCMRYSLETMCNLCLHHVNRRLIYEHRGVEIVVALHIDSDPHVRELSVQIIEHLEDITPPEVIARAKTDIGLDRMILMAKNPDPLVRAVAAESIGEEVWRNKQQQHRAQEKGGVDALLFILSNPLEPIESLLPALWSLRNLMHDNPTTKTQFGNNNGVDIVNVVLRRAFTGQYLEQTEKVIEACLTCYTNAVLHDERNSRRCLKIALEPILDLSDSKIDSMDTMTAKGINFADYEFVVHALSSEGVVALAKSLLLILSPYNYVVCRNCQRKQDLHGTSCFHCGHRLYIDVEGDIVLNTTINTSDNGKLVFGKSTGHQINTHLNSRETAADRLSQLDRKLADVKNRLKQKQGLNPHSSTNKLSTMKPAELSNKISKHSSSKPIKLSKTQPLESFTVDDQEVQEKILENQDKRFVSTS